MVAMVGGAVGRQEMSLEEVLVELGLNGWVVLGHSEVTQNGFLVWHIEGVM